MHWYEIGAWYRSVWWGHASESVLGKKKYYLNKSNDSVTTIGKSKLSLTDEPTVQNMQDCNNTNMTHWRYIVK